jgi:hypothetical protein
MNIKLNNRIMTSVRSGTLKARELVQFILDNVLNTSTNKDINNTSLSDILVEGKQITSAIIDSYKNEIIIELGVDKNV